MISCSWDVASSGSLISTKPSDSHMAPGWSSGELSVLSTPYKSSVLHGVYIVRGWGCCGTEWLFVGCLCVIYRMLLIIPPLC